MAAWEFYMHLCYNLFSPERGWIFSVQFNFWVQGKKWINLPPIFFKLFINFLVVWHLLMNIQKNLFGTFSVLARYGPFWLWAWSKIENFETFHKTKNNYLIKTNDSCFIKKVKFFNFWPCSKSKWVISYQNGKRAWQIFLNIQ